MRGGGGRAQCTRDIYRTTIEMGRSQRKCRRGKGPGNITWVRGRTSD